MVVERARERLSWLLRGRESAPFVDVERAPFVHGQGERAPFVVVERKRERLSWSLRGRENAFHLESKARERL